MDRGDCVVGTVICTAKQTSGVGRHSKSWQSDSGDLAFTMILKPHREEHEQLAYVAALAVGEAVLSYTHGLDLRYKWVNDVMVNGKKLAGILLEKYKYDFLLIGVGLNILPKGAVKDINAIGLSEVDIKTDYQALLKLVLQKFSDLYLAWEQFGFTSVRHQWLERAFKLNEAIKVNLPGDKVIDGIFRSIDCDGQMLLEREHARMDLISAGAVLF